MKAIAAAIALFTLSAWLGAAHAAPGDELYARPGRMVFAGDTELNLDCVGSDSPTVVFDAGWEDWSPTWDLIQPAIARYTRTCTYDRAGSGFSLPGPMPRTTAEIARELHAALHDAGIPGPYLLVGHSFGGYNLRAFADLYMPEVYGAVFVDILALDLESRQGRAAWARIMAGQVRELNECRAALVGRQPLPTMPPGGSYPPDTPCSHQFFRALPMKEWSPALNSAVLHIADNRVALYDAVISELQEMPADATWLRVHRRSFGNRPLRVLTAQGDFHDDAHAPPALRRRRAAFQRRWARTQQRLLALSTDAKQVLVTHSGHYIQFDRPKVVIDAILSELPKRRR